jgi:PPK2 family polyphosphate:nucleotide phosphotransferase
MEINIKDFEFTGDKKFDIKKSKTKIKDFYQSEEEYNTMMAELHEKMDKHQSLMYAHDRYSMLLILQASDAAGKDGTLKAVMSGVNPAGISVESFKRPSEIELGHDFMWRNNIKLPERGNLMIHNRSYYEEVLTVKVHPEILTKYQKIPAEFTKNLDKVWEQRYEDIKNYEKYLTRNGTVILKFYLNVSKEVQAERLIERIEDPTKNWKFQEGDVVERDFWKQYQHAYEDMVNETASKSAAWYVIPADDKKNMRLIISTIILERMKELNMEYPESTPERQETLKGLIARIKEQNEE